MKRISKKTALIASLIIALLCTTIVLAIQILHRSADFSGGVETFGEIELYSDSACTTLFTGFDFDEFDTPSTNKNVSVYIKNIGNVPLLISWNMTASDLTWTVSIGNEGYKYEDFAILRHQIRFTNATKWYPDEVAPTYIPLDRLESIEVLIYLSFDDTVMPSPMTFTFTDTFYANPA